VLLRRRRRRSCRSSCATSIPCSCATYILRAHVPLTYLLLLLRRRRRRSCRSSCATSCTTSARSTSRDPSSYDHGPARPGPRRSGMGPAGALRADSEGQRRRRAGPGANRGGPANGPTTRAWTRTDVVTDAVAARRRRPGYGPAADSDAAARRRPGSRRPAPRLIHPHEEHC
jgi:hypothetical protein